MDRRWLCYWLAFASVSVIPDLSKTHTRDARNLACITSELQFKIRSITYEGCSGDSGHVVFTVGRIRPSDQQERKVPDKISARVLTCNSQ